MSSIRALSRGYKVVQDTEPTERSRGCLLPFRTHNFVIGTIAQVAFTLALAGLAFTAGILYDRRVTVLGQSATVVTQVPLRSTEMTFQFNRSFAKPPPTEGDSEPVWDALLPNGLGYVQDGILAPNLSVISAFHQLHCLYTLRRAYYETSPPDQLKDFDFGLNRSDHTSHCFEYLRQSLICSADSSIEPANEHRGFLGWGFKRGCHDFQQLRTWADAARAFDGHGFLAHDVLDGLATMP